jgi:hypothetical protein
MRRQIVDALNTAFVSNPLYQPQTTLEKDTGGSLALPLIQQEKTEKIVMVTRPIARSAHHLARGRGRCAATG